MQGGGWLPPPYLSWLWSKFWPKNHVSLKAGIISNSFGLFSEFFFQNSQKNWRKLKTYQKLLKMSENSKFCNFWAISTCNTSKESIFLIEFNFTEKKYDLFENFLKKSNFSDFFSKPMLTTCLRSQISQNCAKKFQNWVYLCFGEVLKLKVSKGELIISNGLEMADDYLLGGAPTPLGRYASAISRPFEIMSSPLVTFNFKTFPKHR